MLDADLFFADFARCYFSAMTAAFAFDAGFFSLHAIFAFRHAADGAMPCCYAAISMLMPLFRRAVATTSPHTVTRRPRRDVPPQHTLFTADFLCHALPR